MTHNMACQSWIPRSSKSIALLVGVVCASELAWRIYKKYWTSKKTEQILFNKPIAETFFFSDQASLCRTHSNCDIPCSIPNCPTLTLNKVIEYISSAKRSLDVCVYFLTCQALAKAIVDLRKRNIIVRVITDDEGSENEASQVFLLRKAGIVVRSRKSQYLMHHKFAIIDRKILITGSANWTLQAFFGNFENILITNQKELVNGYIMEYEKLWLKFSSEYQPEVQNATDV